eukprot:11195948-Heterocapsa_arctica.AAC.1
MRDLRGGRPRSEGPLVRKTSARTSGRRISASKRSAATSQGGKRLRGRRTRSTAGRRRTRVPSGEAGRRTATTPTRIRSRRNPVVPPRAREGGTRGHQGGPASQDREAHAEEA